MKTIKPVFIVGTSRGGTTWMMSRLNQHPNVVAYGETCYWGRLFKKPANGRRYSKIEVREVIERMVDVFEQSKYSLNDFMRFEFVDIWKNSIKNIDTSEALPGELYMRIQQALAEAWHVGNVIEKTPHHAIWLNRIWRELPESKIVFMLRRPYEFMLSYKFQGAQSHDAVRDYVQKIYHPLGCALVWRRYYIAALKAKIRKPKNILIVQTEDLFDDSSEILQSIQKFLDLKFDDSVLQSEKNENSSFGSEVKPKLEDCDLFWLNLIAGSCIKQMGVEIKGSNVFSVSVLKSFLALPKWAWVVFFTLRRKSVGSVFSYIINWLRPIT